MSRNIEDCFRISAWQLEDEGFFDFGHPGQRSWSRTWVDPARCRETTKRLVVEWGGQGVDEIVVRVFWDDQQTFWGRVKLQQSTRRRIYFICPLTGKRTDALYSGYGEFGSRQALGLRYPCQRVTTWEYAMLKQEGYTPADLGHDPMPKRVVNRRRERLPPLQSFDDYLAAHQAWRAQRKVREEQDRLQKLSDTEGALFRATGVQRHDHKSNAALSLSTASQIVVTEPGQFYAPLPRDAPLLIFEDQPRLDLRTLAARGFLRPGERSWCNLIWHVAGARLGTVYVMIDLCDPRHPYVELIFGGWDRTAYRQKIALTPPPRRGQRRRYSFHIQGHGSAEVLAYRDHRFAPRTLQRLVNASQRSGSEQGRMGSPKRRGGRGPEGGLMAPHGREFADLRG